jgi:hypothetical protein
VWAKALAAGTFGARLGARLQILSRRCDRGQNRKSENVESVLRGSRSATDQALLRASFLAADTMRATSLPPRMTSIVCPPATLSK